MPSRGKRVLVFIDDGSYAFDNRVQREAQTLRRAGYDVSVVCPRYPGEPRDEVAEGVRVFRFRKWRLGSGFVGHCAEYLSSLFAGGGRALEVALFRGGADVFHACNPPDHLFLIGALFKAAGKRFVFDHHDLTPELYRSRFGGGEGAVHSILLFMEKRSLRLADGVIATNDSYRRIEIERGGIPGERIAVVRNGPDLRKFVPAKEGERPSAPPIRVGYLGNMNPQDGVDVLLRAASELIVTRGRKDIEFVLVGGGDSLPSLRAEAERLGLGSGVRFTGRVDDATMLAALRSCHVGVQPDPWSPLNAVSTMNKASEYMALGLAVVAFDLPETRVTCGDAALLVPPDEPAALAAAIERLADDPALRVRLGSAGRRRAEDRLRWERSEGALLALYDLLTAPRARLDLRIPGLPALRDVVSRRLFWPIAGRAIRFNRRVARAERRANLQRFLPGGESERARVESLRRLLRFCRDRVPYYRRLFREVGFRPDSVASVRDLADLPPLDRRVLQERFAEFVPEGIDRRRLIENHSGGSTGEPVKLLHDARFESRAAAALLWSDGLAGWRPGDRTAFLWGAPSDVRLARGIRAGVRHWLWNREVLDAFDMGEEKLRAFHERLRVFRPEFLVAYASSAFLLARFLRETGRTASYPRRGVITSAEVLTGSMRREIEAALPAPIFDRYGSREVGIIAAECRAHAGLHVNEADLVVEGLDPITGRPVSLGEAEVVVTALNGFGTPLVRYRLGDLAEFDAAGPCPCGLHTRRLRQVVGRACDAIWTLDGTLVHGEWFTHLLYGIDAIRQFRFTQTGDSRYRLELETDGSDTAILRGELLRAIKEKLGAAAEVEIVAATSLPPAPSGKRRFTVSELPVRFARSAAVEA